MIDLEWLTTQVAGLVRETGVFIAAEFTHHPNIICRQISFA